MTINTQKEGFNLFRVQQTTGTVDTFTEHTIYVSTNTWGVNDWVEYGLRFTSGEYNEHTYVINSSLHNSITCSGSFTGQVFPGQFPFNFSSLANTDTWEIIEVGKGIDNTFGGRDTFPLIFDWFFKDIVTKEYLNKTQQIKEYSTGYNYGWEDSYSFYPLFIFESQIFPGLFPFKFAPVVESSVFRFGHYVNPYELDYLDRTDEIIAYPVGYNYGFDDLFYPGTLMVFPFKFGYTQNPLWGAYTVKGQITACFDYSSAYVRVRATNLDNDEYTDVTADSSGVYEVDLSEISRIFEDGDDIRMSTTTDYKDFIIDYYDDLPHRVVNLDYCAYPPTEIEITNMMSCKINRSISERAGSATLQLENKNGRRTIDFAAMRPIIIKIANQTLFKGRIINSYTDSHHILHINAEDYSGLLHTSFIGEQQYTGRTVYDIITNATDGLIVSYLSEVNTTYVKNDADTQRVITIKFEKISIADALKQLGDMTTELGYRYYVDENKYLFFEERRAVDSGIMLTNTGSQFPMTFPITLLSKSITSWDWNNTGQDIYSEITVLGAENIFPYEFPIIFGMSTTFPQQFPFQFGTRIIEVIEDSDAQALYGLRDAPPYDDPGISSITEAKYIGENILKLKGNPINDIEVTGYGRYKDHTFNYTFPLPFKIRSGMADLQPGDLVKTNLVGANLPQENLFPWTFTTNFTPADRVIQEFEYKYPESTVKLKLLEFYKDTEMIISREVK